MVHRNNDAYSWLSSLHLKVCYKWFSRTFFYKSNDQEALFQCSTHQEGWRLDKVKFWPITIFGFNGNKKLSWLLIVENFNKIIARTRLLCDGLGLQVHVFGVLILWTILTKQISFLYCCRLFSGHQSSDPLVLVFTIIVQKKVRSDINMMPYALWLLGSPSIIIVVSGVNCNCCSWCCFAVFVFLNVRPNNLLQLI